MMHDVRKEFAGSYSTFKDKQDSTGGDQASGEVIQTADPNIHAMKWMNECQHSYTDAQLDFWLLLRPLTDGVKILADNLPRLLSVWHWASAVEAPTYPHNHINEHRFTGCERTAERMKDNCG